MSATVIRFPLDPTKPPKTAGDHTQNAGVTCTAQLERRYHTGSEAHEYLLSRGFLVRPFGWTNGRWRARVEMRSDDFIVLINLTAASAA